jgi:hypothetical protein
MERTFGWFKRIGGTALFFIFAAVARITLAAGLVTCGNDANSVCTWTDLMGSGGNSLVSKVTKFALFDFAVPIAVGFIIWGGIKMITAGGNESRFADGKKIITGVLWGLLIAFSAWIIINTVIAILTG